MAFASSGRVLGCCFPQSVLRSFKTASLQFAEDEIAGYVVRATGLEAFTFMLTTSNALETLAIRCGSSSMVLITSSRVPLISISWEPNLTRSEKGTVIIFPYFDKGTFTFRIYLQDAIFIM
jgi:hypothetical protein